MAPNSLLSDSIFSVRTGDAIRTMSLPGVLSSLSAGDDIVFWNLRPHQRHAWHAFLVQIAAIAMHSTNAVELPKQHDAWVKTLLRLTNEDHDPWSLVVEDFTKPAFMQCPIPEKSTERWKTIEYPDDLDVLVTAKNHDVKFSRISSPSLDQWVYALVSLQTMQGYPGRGHYGIARMNSGIGSRPCVTLAPSERPCDRFARDVRILRQERGAVARMLRSREDGLALLWLNPWNGKKPLRFSELDPFFIEVCSRVRFRARLTEGSQVRWSREIFAKQTHTEGPHIHDEEAKEAKGHTGDLWTPIRCDDHAALSLKASGFSYETAAEFLYGAQSSSAALSRASGWIPPAALRLQTNDGLTPVALFHGLARGQGKTEGFHERTIPLRGVLLEAVDPNAPTRAQVSSTCSTWIESVRTVRLRVLKPSILCLLQGAPDKLKFEDSRVDSYLEVLTSTADKAFFSEILPADQDSVPPDRKWNRFLLDQAFEIFSQAIDSVPIPLGRSDRTIAIAIRTFFGCVRNSFSEALWTRPEPEKSPVERRRQAYANLFAKTLMHHTSAIDLAQLRRLRLGEVESEPFCSLYKRLVHHREDPSSPADTRWTLIFRTMAELVGLHRSGISLGHAMVRAGFASSRVHSVLRARACEMPEAIQGLVRALLQSGVSSNQAEILGLILSNGHRQHPEKDAWPTKVRRKIVRDYYASV